MAENNVDDVVEPVWESAWGVLVWEWRGFDHVPVVVQPVWDQVDDYDAYADRQIRAFWDCPKPSRASYAVWKIFVASDDTSMGEQVAGGMVFHDQADLTEQDTKNLEKNVLSGGEDGILQVGQLIWVEPISKARQRRPRQDKKRAVMARLFDLEGFE